VTIEAKRKMVIPAQAGIQPGIASLDSGVRRNDGE